VAHIEIVRGSLLDQDVDAIVNAANTMMRGGGGIDGAIHRAAGPKLLLELQKVAPRGCRTGEVVVTGGHATPFKFILHTPGPIWRGGGANEDDLLASCYRKSVERAAELGVRSLAFPSISTGAYGFPIDRAAPIALRAVREGDAKLDRIVFAMFGAHEHQAFLDADS